MALQSSGAISIGNLATEFGDSTPNAMSEFYRGGSLVGTNNTNVPASGAIALSDFYDATAALVLNVTSAASAVNILTLATAAGYNAGTDTTPIIVNISAAITGSGTNGHALRTGSLNAASNLTINVNSGGSVSGGTGANGSSAGSAGGQGGDAVLFEIGSGTGTYVVNVASGTTIGGGSGGAGQGGAGGSAGSRYYRDDKNFCTRGPQFGSNGAQGSAGTAGGFGLAQAGTAGSSGSSGTYGGDSTCPIGTSVGSGSPGGAGGAAGKAVNFGGLTVTVNNSGTIHGSTS